MIDNFINYEVCKEISEIWNKYQKKYISDETIFWIPTDDLYKLRKLKRTRKNSLSGSVSLDYISIGKSKKRFKKLYNEEYVDGNTKWDLLLESMDNEGWLPSHPAIIMVSNRRSMPKIRDGHHRLGVARELGINMCPVKFYYVWK